MYDWLTSLPAPIHAQSLVMKAFFLVLDADSATDRSVTLISKGPIWVDKEGKTDEHGEVPDEELSHTLFEWRRHRVPFGRLGEFWTVLHVMPGSEGEEYLRNRVREEEGGEVTCVG
jgi:hypothetical protein